MGLRIQNNIAAMNAHRQLTISDAGLSKSLEKLSSGYRINRAADDAAGLSISQAFRADIASYKAAARNTTEASALLQVAEGAMDQIGNMLTRLKELATQAASANAAANLDKIDAEAQELLGEMQRIATSSEYGGTALLDGTFAAAVFQVGAKNQADNQLSISLGDAQTAALGVDALSLATTAGAQTALDLVDTAIGTLNGVRGDIGAYMNRLSYAAANLASTIENVQAAESVIRDVDMAAEMTTFTKNQILLQAGTAMLAQANMAPQQVLSLFG
ncbi:MAG: flagellin FliC [Deltaproteobacteria bacterium HGW-Deltaproteobacteria-21]|nr:MAG: flagellin FliC [Deltaproteobacteria bacterium HGW-Deltaproteobacteria-21]